MSGSKQLWHVVDKRSMRLSTDADMSRLVSSLDYHSQPLLFESLQGEESLSRLPEFSIRFLHTSSHLNCRELACKQLTLNMEIPLPRRVTWVVSLRKLRP